MNQPEHIVRTLDNLVHDARVPDIPEIREAFEHNSNWLRHLLPNA